MGRVGWIVVGCLVVGYVAFMLAWPSIDPARDQPTTPTTSRCAVSGDYGTNEAMINACTG